MKKSTHKASHIKHRTRTSGSRSHVKRHARGFLGLVARHLKISTAVVTCILMGTVLVASSSAVAPATAKDSGETGRTGDIDLMADNWMCIDVKDGVKKDRTMIRLWTCNNQIAQKATLDLSKNGHMTIKMMESSDWCLDIPDGKSNSKIQLYKCNDAPAQEWLLYKNGNIMNPATKQCIGVKGNNVKEGTELHLQSCGSNSKVRWNFPSGGSPLIEKVGTMSFKGATVKDSNGVAVKKPKSCITSAPADKSIKTSRCNTSNKLQKWSVVRVKNGKHYKYMNGENCLATTNDDIISQKCTNSRSQLWSIDSNKLKNLENEKCIDTKDHRTGNGKVIATFDCGTVKNTMNIPKFKTGEGYAGANGTSRPSVKP